jgi:hypothetical protein
MAETAGRCAATHVEPLTNIADSSATISDLRLSADGSRISYPLQSKTAVTELVVRDLARKKRRAVFRCGGCPVGVRGGWDDSIVVLRLHRETGR